MDNLEDLFRGLDYKIKWWEKLCLWFIPEMQSRDGNTICYFKKWRGIIYITDIVTHFTWDIVLPKEEK